jgi:hypothetical protein
VNFECVGDAETAVLNERYAFAGGYCHNCIYFKLGHRCLLYIGGNKKATAWHHARQSLWDSPPVEAKSVFERETLLLGWAADHELARQHVQRCVGIKRLPA